MGSLNLLQNGDKAPNFSFKDPVSQEIQDTSTLMGKPYLVYFYPRDNTPGCTKEACGFRDLFKQFQQAGLTIIGVSCDTETSHEKFRAKHDLPFPLVADTDKKLVNAFGVWAKKTFMGRVFDGIHRVSFLVGPKGNIIKVYPKVKAAAHPDEVLGYIKNL